MIGFRQGVVLVEAIEISREGGGLRKVADGIEAGIGAELVEQAGVIVAQSAEVQLLGPAFFRIEPCRRTAS